MTKKQERTTKWNQTKNEEMCCYYYVLCQREAFEFCFVELFFLFVWGVLHYLSLCLSCEETRNESKGEREKTKEKREKKKHAMNQREKERKRKRKERRRRIQSLFPTAVSLLSFSIPSFHLLSLHSYPSTQQAELLLSLLPYPQFTSLRFSFPYLLLTFPFVL
jgi:hypothetical protein